VKASVLAVAGDNAAADATDTMTAEQAISLYLRLTDDIHTYWGAIGAVSVLLLGWMMTRKAPLRLAQRIALTVGWLGAAGYLGSSVMNRYRLLLALTQDVEKLRQATPAADLSLLRALTEFSSVYANYEILVWTSLGVISLGMLVLLWTNVVFDRSIKGGSDC